MSIDFTGARIAQSMNFLDYVYGGCEINLSVAIDFSLANLNPQDANSLHRLQD